MCKHILRGGGKIKGEESLGALLSGYGGYWDLFAVFR